MAWFQNHYHCDECDESWTDSWSCTCDDECPSCGKDYTPEASDDLSVVVYSASYDTFEVLVSSDSAEDHPDYQTHASFGTAAEANAEAVRVTIFR